MSFTEVEIAPCESKDTRPIASFTRSPSNRFLDRLTKRQMDSFPEGAGICVLKRHKDALKDGDKIYAIIRGIGSSSDGEEKACTNPVRLDWAEQ